MQTKKYLNLILSALLILSFSFCKQSKKEEKTETDQKGKITKRGWNLLAHNKEKGFKALAHANDYNINHLQISHHIIMDLQHVKEKERLDLCRKLTKEAHKKGIEEVTVWDHQLYSLDYYPDKFKTGPNNTINLDNKEFWQWLKDDYRSMLDSIPNMDGIILTFIETGAHVEDQYSEKLKTEEEKLAALVDTIAGIVIDERNMSLYIRTFAYSRSELSSILKCVDLIDHPDVRVMSKEVPHDFHLYHPTAWYIDDINAPVMIEFDCTHEFNGQGILASIFPQVHLKRWKHYRKLDNVFGYVARTDRYGNTQIVGRPSEINLYALKRASENPDITADQIFNEFITKHYGKKSIKYVKPAFKNAYDIFTSVFHTLGLHSNNHSKFGFYESCFSRHVSGKWLDTPKIHIKHGVDKTFHYWKDIVNHLSPPKYKKKEGTTLARESPRIIDSGWVQPKEFMTRKYLDYAITEKNYGVETAKESVEHIKKAKAYIEDSAAYSKLYHTFRRTYITSKLYRGYIKAYFGERIYNRGETYQGQELKSIIREGLKEMKTTAQQIRNYPVKGPSGQYDWSKDAERAMNAYREIKEQI